MKPLLQTLAALALVAAWLAPAAAHAASAVVSTPQVRAELVAHAPEGVAPGKPMWLGLKIQHQPHWHTYWKNPGDSGLPTTVEWKLPAGLSAGDIQWPTPSRLPIGPLMNFGYEGLLLLPVPLSVSQAPTGDTVELQLRADWLVCKDVCIPEGGDFVLRLPVRAATAGHAELFASAKAAAPQSAPGASATATVEADQLVVRATALPAAWQGKALRFFPETAGLIQNAAVPAATWNGADWTARIALDAQRSEAPTQIPVVLTREGQAAGLALQVAVTTPWPAAATPPAALPPINTGAAVTGGTTAGTGAAAAGSPGSATTLWALLGAMGLALMGGALLNLMPCVFPVLSLKVLSFADHAHQRRTLLAGGLAYTAGVVMSFVALAALLLALRAGGEQLGWGFQLQSPAVVAGLAALFTLIGLNLLGVFELGSVLPSSWATARARHPAADAWLTGVLAVAVASPCTAPFMGAALGLALGLPAWQALLIFAALGLGMALPYLAASAWPGLARALPRPGIWMAHFKAVMAFPMFATVVWLVWVLGQQVGIDGAAVLLALLLALSFAAWAWGSPALGPRARYGFGAASVLVLALTMAWGLPMLRTGDAALPGSSAATAPPPGAGASAGDPAAWQAWSVERVAQAQAQGQPVFVDFTAAWCVTCQFNKRTTLADAEVKAMFDNKRVLLLRADWTRRDPAISAELARLQRSGVPVYALYAPGQAQPTLLSEILSVDEVRKALSGLPSRT
jgi:thiol:disulfide interchange protein